MKLLRSRLVGRRGLAAAVLVVAASFVLGSCASAPVVTTEPAYRTGQLRGKRVLFARLAVSDDFEDARTGVMLSGRTRSAAARDACARTARAWTGGTVACFELEDDAPISEIERLFARDQIVPRRTLQAIRADSNADLLLLFRPESVMATQALDQEKVNQNFFTSSEKTAVPTSEIVSGVHAAPIRTTNETERSYKISASLVELRSGKQLKRGEHSGSVSRVEKHYSGIAPSPNATPLLADLMTDLARALLED